MNPELNDNKTHTNDVKAPRKSHSSAHLRPSSKLKIITTNRLVVFAVIIVSIILGLAVSFIPFKFQIALIGLFPALLGGVLILFRPFIGIYAFYFYEYFRPDYVFPALSPLRLALVIEIATLAAWIIHLMVKRTGIIWHKFNWLYVGFVGVIGSTVYFAANNRFAYDIFQAMVITFIVFLIATNTLNNMKRLRVLVTVLLLVHFYFGVKGIQTGGFVGGGLMGDENDLALAMNVFIPFAYFFFAGAKTFLEKSFYLAMLISTTFATIVSLSRGGTVGLLAVITYIIIKSKQRLASFAVVILLGLVVLTFAPSKYWEDASTITDTSEATAQTRLLYWMAAVRMWIDHPIAGVGAANGPIRMPEYYQGHRASTTQWGRTFHGTLPQILAELGTLGMLFYIAMMFMAAKLLMKMRRQNYVSDQQNIHKLSDSILGGIIAFIVTGTFLSTAYYPQLWTMYVLTLTLYHISEKLKVENNTTIEPEIFTENEILPEGTS